MGALSIWAESDHPRDEHGKFAIDSEHASALVRFVRGADIEKSYSGIGKSQIQHVHEFDGSTGLTAVVTLKNGKDKYLYTAEHDQQQADKKFARSVALGERIDDMRRGVATDLQHGDPKTQDLAAITQLIDQHCIRVGGKPEEERTGSSGASTIKAEHVFRSADGSVRLMFQGKNDKRWSVKIADPVLAQHIIKAADGKGPGDKLFKASPTAVNDYVRAKAGIDMSAKDFRTFHATRVVRDELGRAPAPKNAKECEANIRAAVAKAAVVLGNTPPVCRSTYVNPAVIEQYELRHRKGAAS